jgi:hypothetical protein
MGMPMALGIRQIAEEDRRLVAWAWACNGAAAVVGTNVCMIIMVYWGMPVVFFLGACCYLLAGALLGKMTRPATAPAMVAVGSES